MSATKQPRNLEIVVHQRETPFVGLRAHLRERGLLIPPTLPRASWEPPAAQYPLHDAADEVITGDGVEPEAPQSPRRPSFSLPTSLPSSAPTKRATSGAQPKPLSTPMQPALQPPSAASPAAPKPLPAPSLPAPSLPAPSLPAPSLPAPSLPAPSLSAPPSALSAPKPLAPPPMQAPSSFLSAPRPPTSPGLPPPPRPASMQLTPPASMHQLPTAGYDSSAALAGLSDEALRAPPTAELKWRDAEALLQQSKASPSTTPINEDPRTSRAEQHTVQLDLSAQGFSLTLSFISQTRDQTAMELILALRGELSSILAHEADEPHRLATDRAYARQIEQVILRFFSARMPQYPVVTADLVWLHA